MDDFYAARSDISTPLPWQTLAPPFSIVVLTPTLNDDLRLGDQLFEGEFLRAERAGEISVEPTWGTGGVGEAYIR